MATCSGRRASSASSSHRDESIRVPFMIRCPGLLGQRGRTLDGVMNSPDILPTPARSVRGGLRPWACRAAVMPRICAERARHRARARCLRVTHRLANGPVLWAGGYHGGCAIAASPTWRPWRGRGCCDSPRRPLSVRDLAEEAGYERLRARLQDDLSAASGSRGGHLLYRRAIHCAVGLCGGRQRHRACCGIICCYDEGD